MREYQPAPSKNRHIREEQIQAVFEQLDKTTYGKQNFNCDACGSQTCRDMARKIALSINLPINCTITEAGRRRNAEYIDLVHRIGDTLLAAGDDEGHSRAVIQALHVLADTVQAEAATLWRRQTDTPGEEAFGRASSWFKNTPMSTAAIRGTWPEEWIDILKIGKPVERKNPLQADTGQRLFPDNILSLLLVPVHIRATFWGFLAVVNANEHLFGKEEISLLDASGALLVSSILEQETAQSLIRAREDALATTQAKSDFLSRMSHEMRTPLNAVVGMATIADKTQDTEKLRHCLSTIHTSSAHLLGLINDVLDMAKIEAGKLELDASPFNLEQMLSNVCDIVTNNMEKK